MESSTQLDHRATWDEVREALEVSSLDAFGRCPGQEVCCKVASGSRVDVRFTAEELAWLALAKEALNSICN